MAAQRRPTGSRRVVPPDGTRAVPGLPSPAQRSGLSTAPPAGPDRPVEGTAAQASGRAGELEWLIQSALSPRIRRVPAHDSDFGRVAALAQPAVRPPHLRAGHFRAGQRLCPGGAGVLGARPAWSHCGSALPGPGLSGVASAGVHPRDCHSWSSNSTGPFVRRPPRPAGYTKQDPHTEPDVFKRFPLTPVVELPSDLPAGAAAATDVLSGRTRPRGTKLEVEDLARLLHLSLGVIRVSPGSRRPRRPASSAGNLHPVEAYVVPGSLSGLDNGVYHFAAQVHGLERLRDGDHRAFVENATASSADRPAAEAFVVLTGIPWRTAWKYAERGWRHLYWDAGTVIANLLAVADAYGIDARLLFGFQDAMLCHLLGIDGRIEFPLVVVALGQSPSRPRPLVDHMAPVAVAAEELPAGPVEFPVITVAQLAGVLRGEDEVQTWRREPCGHGPAAAITPPAPRALGAEPVDALILGHATTRTMTPEPIPEEVLNWAMACATRPVPMDAIPEGHTLLTHHLSVHTVDGMEPGHYLHRYPALTARRLLPLPEVRSVATHLCLDQAVAGDSAFTVFSCSDLATLLPALGDRGYRGAQAEAGVVIGRLQLAASALGYGASALTFFDDEVAGVLQTGAACMLAAAVGTSARRGFTDRGRLRYGSSSAQR
ncbi:SagB family peptide dehydrogenase [Streptomyces sp. NPDC101151]|uniref:SagB family peptide dehydrogenase n=1 Tax=Streptomyces sp. NPDC101151 TaxID=3366115 RepID=UPI00382241CB